jgi:N-acetylmuramic acid 6-phosphate (MurNAc-6-P) etherase
MALEDHLLTEARNPHSADIDKLDAAGIVALMNAEDAKVVAAASAPRPRRSRRRSSGRRSGSAAAAG